jgi:small subunit ribosomal protein S2
MEVKNIKEDSPMSEQEKEVVVTPTSEETMESIAPSPTEPIITMKKLAAAGVQYGHQTRKWNPKMAPYIYGAHNGIYIIDLKKTVTKIEEAYLKLKEIVTAGGKVLFVGTKKQVQELVKVESLRSGSFYINNRWLGGTLTNFKTILGRIRYLKDLETQEADGTLEQLPKKEVSSLRKLKEKLLKNLEGIKEMRRVPQAVFVVDPMIDHNAVSESKKLGIPVFGIIDTNADPDLVDYPIPGNDDAVGSVRMILQVMADAIVESKGGFTEVAYIKEDEFLDRYAAMKAETRAATDSARTSSFAARVETAPVAEEAKIEVKTETSVKKEKTTRSAKAEQEKTETEE